MYKTVNFVLWTKNSNQIIWNDYFRTGIVFNEFDDQFKVQRNLSMVVLRSLGYGKKSIEHKICQETQHLIDVIKV